MTEITRRQTASPAADNVMVLQPIATMPAEMKKNGRGLLLHGRHLHDSGREGDYVAGDYWWAIGLWDIWRPRFGQRWVFALNGAPLDAWGEPTHWAELKLP